MENQNISMLKVASSPHVRTTTDVQSVMLDVLIALIPAFIASIFYFGYRSIILTLVSVAACIFFEFVSQKVMKKKVTIKDLSAAVTGVLLAFNVPSTLPIPMIIVGSAFSIIVVKQMFGGLGNNFLNPALAGRAFLLASWPQSMSNFVTPFNDAVSTATPLVSKDPISIFDLIIGKHAGVLGEVSVLAILIGAIYLVIRGVINLRIPVVMIASFAIFELIFPNDISFTELPYDIFKGGLFLGAFFMATDYSTSPMTNKGQLIFAVGAGFMTALIRSYGGYPEGVSYAIMLMNVCTPLIDKLVKNKPFGYVKEKK